MGYISLRLKSGSGAGNGAPPDFGEINFTDNYSSDKLYLPDIQFQGTQAGTTRANEIYFQPFIPKRTHTFTGIGIISTTTSNNSRLAIYDAVDNMPTDVILETASFAHQIGLLDNTISLELIGGKQYYLAWQTDAASNLWGYAASSLTNVAPITGRSNGFKEFQLTGTASLWKCYIFAQTFGAFPDPVTVNAIDPGSTVVPLILLRG